MPDRNQQAGSQFVDVDNLEWQVTRFPGVSTKVLWQDADGEGFTALFWMVPGSTLPLHRHPEIEQTFVLEGSLVDDEGACTAGNFVWRRAGSVHAVRAPEGCLAIGIFRKPNEFLRE